MTASNLCRRLEVVPRRLLRRPRADHCRRLKPKPMSGSFAAWLQRTVSRFLLSQHQVRRTGYATCACLPAPGARRGDETIEGSTRNGHPPFRRFRPPFEGFALPSKVSPSLRSICEVLWIRMSSDGPRSAFHSPLTGAGDTQQAFSTYSRPENLGRNGTNDPPLKTAILCHAKISSSIAANFRYSLLCDHSHRSKAAWHRGTILPDRRPLMP